MCLLWFANPFVSSMEANMCISCVEHDDNCAYPAHLLGHCLTLTRHSVAVLLEMIIWYSLMTRVTKNGQGNPDMQALCHRIQRF